MEGRPLIQGNHVLRNDAGPDGLGGGIVASDRAEVVGNLIERNTADSGGGLHLHWGSPTARDNVIRGNQATGWTGGGVFWATDGALVVNNLITG